LGMLQGFAVSVVNVFDRVSASALKAFLNWNYQKKNERKLVL